MLIGYLLYMGPLFPIAVVADLLFPDSISQPMFDFFNNIASQFWNVIDMLFGIV